MNIQDCVTAKFFVHIDGMVMATISFWRDREFFIVQIQDDSHEDLIDTLEAIWPEWTDSDQDLARSAH